MKLGSTISLLIFLNFIALPSIATVFKWELPITNVVISEEKSQHSPLMINEKSLPKIFNINDFLIFLKNDLPRKLYILIDDSRHRSPFRSIFSPPPNL